MKIQIEDFGDAANGSQVEPADVATGLAVVALPALQLSKPVVAVPIASTVLPSVVADEQQPSWPVSGVGPE